MISLIVSLTLSPALCALLLKPHDSHRKERWWEKPLHRFFGVFNLGFDKLASGYGWLAARVVRYAVVMLVIYAGVIVFGLWEFAKTPRGFIPALDRGYMIVVANLPPGASLQRTDAVQRRIVEKALKVPGVIGAVNIVGFSGATFTNSPNAGAAFLVLDSFEKRAKDPNQSAAGLQRALFAAFADIQEAGIFVVQPPPVQGIGNAGGFRMIVEDRAGRGAAALQAATYAMMGRAAQTQGLVQVFSIFETSTPQLYLDIDRVKAQMLGINTPDVFNALQVYLGSSYVNDFPNNGRMQRVIVQADERARMDAEQVLQLNVRNAQGGMVPLSTLGTLRPIVGPETVSHYNNYASAVINGTPAPGFSSGQAIAAMERAAAIALPRDFSFEWTGITFQELKAGSIASVVFALAIVFVFLILAAQYESWSMPFMVLLAVPLALFGALAALWIRGLQIDVYSQIGFVMLIGLAAKNAILIVEFAKHLRESGMGIVEAAMEAGRLRLRPILMTAFAFILGVVPLMLATGAGAASRQSIGTTVFGGMLAATVLTLLMVPVFYALIERAREAREARSGSPDSGHTPGLGAEPAE